MSPDVTIVVNGRTEYPSHRLILCASSDVFQCMLMNPSWTESRENRVELKESSACANCFEDFLRYVIMLKEPFKAFLGDYIHIFMLDN